MDIRRRHVIYVQGYDPRGLAQYYRMFRVELRKFASLHGLTATIGRPAGDPDGLTTTWTIDTQGDGWQTGTTYDFLRWEDLIKADFDVPIWRTVPHAMLLLARMLLVGTIFKFWAAHWRFALFVLYPYVIVLTDALLALGLAALIAEASMAIGLSAWVAWAIALAAFVAGGAALLVSTERWTWALYLLRDIIFTWEFAHHLRPLWRARIDRFAVRLIELAKRSDADEIIIVGHSSGSFLASEIVARALRLDPALGRHGPKIVLLTLGANLPIVGFHANATDFRDNLSLLATEPAIDWIDCQSRKDVMNFFPFDPVSGHGLRPGPDRRNPTIMAVRFREVIRDENYRRFRWRFFRVHFQFVMANEVPAPYDYFMIACGPLSAAKRFRRPHPTRTGVMEPATESGVA